MSSSCCHSDSEESRKNPRKDWFFYSLLAIGGVFYIGHLLNQEIGSMEGQVAHLFHAFFDLFNEMSWGIVLGIVFVGLIGRIPREYIVSILGKPGTTIGVFRATLAGLLLDLCNHGILMVGMKLYERGASLGQVMAFLIASPWNSISLTLILISLVGLKWTLVFIILSGVIAIISGVIFNGLERRGILPKNPHEVEIPSDFNFKDAIKKDFKNYKFSTRDSFQMLLEGLKDSKMIIKWILFGAILSSLIQVFVDKGIFEQYFGPSLLGLSMTLIATTVIEVCSEGATPIAADLINRASAAGNGFVFLMAGVATDYTEIMALKETTKSWKVALFLPLITVPQILILGFILNQVGA